MGRECQSGECQPRSCEQTMQWRLHGRAAASHQLHKAPAAMAAPPSMCNPWHYGACSSAPGQRNAARQHPVPAHLPLRFSAMTMSLLVTVARRAYSVRTTASPMTPRSQSWNASSAPSCGSSSMPLPTRETPAGQGAGQEAWLVGGRHERRQRGRPGGGDQGCGGGAYRTAHLRAAPACACRSGRSTGRPLLG